MLILSVMNYRKNYFKTYFWQSISVLLGFAALFVVIPFISSNKTIYGIYSVCTSLTIFFSYADLGFLSSGIKYAAEYYVKGQREEEIRILGFTAFVMILVFFVLALGIVTLSIFPRLLIPELVMGSDSMYIARWLLITLALSCPIAICHRLLNLVFTIRVEDYKFQRINIVGNILRIVSVLYFFGGGRYMIVEYYIFYQIVHLLVVLVALLYVRNHYGYNLRFLISTFHFDRNVFNKVKKLTGTSLVITFASVLYYELDQIVISNVLGLDAVAHFAIALSVLQLVRTFNAIVYSPYTSRYNHFIGLGDYEGLTHFVKKMIILFAPIIIIPLLTLSLNAAPFVVSWVGDQYKESALLVSFLVLCFVFNFEREPINQYFVASERNRLLILYNSLTPIIYWIGIFVSIRWLGILSFALMKFVAPLPCIVAYWILAQKDFKHHGCELFSLSRVLKVIVPPALSVIILSWTFSQWMVFEHGSAALFFNIVLMAVMAVMSFIISIPFNSEMIMETKHYFHHFIKTNNK